METEFNRNFIAVQKCIEFLSYKPVVNVGYVFTDIDGVPYDFTGWNILQFKIWEDSQDGKLLLTMTNAANLTLAASTITMNCDD
ncbi:MAG TPA: hypothetical protein VFD46_08085, partial [Chryseolinea sp.]|nr:hypothetical protein [Chryseolinea sp.]